MKNQTVIIIVIVIAAIFLVNSNILKSNQSVMAFHKEDSSSACESYIDGNPGYNCQSSCWQHTSAIQTCMAANGYSGLSDNIGSWYEYHSNNGANCKAALEWEMVSANYGAYDRVIASVKCIPPLQSYGAVVPGNCNTLADTDCNQIVSWSEINTAISKWLSSQYTWTQINQFIGAWLS